MKNFTSCFMLALTMCLSPFFLGSCSDDAAFMEKTSASDSRPNTLALKESTRPANPANYYDAAGKIHNEILEAYGSMSNPITIDGIINRVESMANQNVSFVAVKGANYNAVTPVRAAYLLEHKTNCLDDAINATGMDFMSKAEFQNFINSLIPLCSTANGYDPVYKFILEYEAAVIGNGFMPDKDKRIILTCTSIIRYATFFKEKKPKKNTDPDWEIMVTHIIATIDGIPNSTAKAVSEGLVLGIAENL